MSAELTLPLAFTTGVFGALHCLGMCSGMAGGFFVHSGGGLVRVLAYHGARILVYAALGMAGAAAGRVLVQTGILGKGQGLLTMGAGLVILLLGLTIMAMHATPTMNGVHRHDPSPTPALPRNGRGIRNRRATFMASLTGWLPRLRRGRADRCEPPSGGMLVSFAYAPPSARPWAPMLAGALNGMVPCSLVFSVAVKAASTGDPLEAGLLMLAFGLGTLPTMGLVGLTGAAIGRGAQGLFAQLAGLTVAALGLWTLYEGWIFFDVMRGLAD